LTVKQRGIWRTPRADASLVHAMDAWAKVLAAAAGRFAARSRHVSAPGEN
jgi:hypothetical protein